MPGSYASESAAVNIPMSLVYGKGTQEISGPAQFRSVNVTKEIRCTTVAFHLKSVVLGACFLGKGIFFTIVVH